MSESTIQRARKELLVIFPELEILIQLARLLENKQNHKCPLCDGTGKMQEPK